MIPTSNSEDNTVRGKLAVRELKDGSAMKSRSIRVPNKSTELPDHLIN